MSQRQLLIRPGDEALSTQQFAWRDRSVECSFLTDLDPDLGGIGNVPVPNRDLVAVATAVFLADRTTRRPRGWRRAIELEVPVYDPAAWAAVSDDLSATLRLLASDEWTLNFVQRGSTEPPSELTEVRNERDRALLFSGGADSLCGAVEALTQGARVQLVSHWDWTGHSGVQRLVVRELEARFPGQVVLRQVHLGRRNQQLGGGQFGDEPSRRTRSLLFIALGLAVASTQPKVGLWIAENGYAALNPPLAGERRGALSTRTTNPLVLDTLQRVFRRVGAHADFENVFGRATKGQMFARVASILGTADASKLLSLSHSCSHVRWAAGTGYPPETQCGVCFGCLVRRAAFHASGVQDQTIYLHKAIATDDQPPHLRTAAQSEVRTVRYAGSRGIAAADLLSIGLPEDLALANAMDVAANGLHELASVVEAEADLARVR